MSRLLFSVRSLTRPSATHFTSTSIVNSRLVHTLLDQAVVSLQNFGTVVLIGRFCGAEQLGIYVVCFTTILLASAACESLVIAPYMVQTRSKGTHNERTYLGSVVAHQIVLALLCSLALTASALLADAFDRALQFTAPLLMLAIALPAILIRELSRRYSMAKLRAQNALVVDVAAAVMQMAGLLGLAATEQLDATTALGALAAANIASIVPWWLAEQPRFRLTLRAIHADFQRNVSLGMWNLCALLTFIVLLYGVPWTLTALGDQLAVGVFGAAHSLVMMTNPLTQGIANNLMPVCANTWRDGSFACTRPLVQRYSLLLFGALAVASAPLILLGDFFLSFLFGEGFAGHGALVAVLTLAAIVRAGAMASYIALWAAGGSATNAGINVIALLTLFASFTMLYPRAGLLGAGVAVLSADTVAAALRFNAFYRLGFTNKAMGG